MQIVLCPRHMVYSEVCTDKAVTPWQFIFMAWYHNSKRFSDTVLCQQQLLSREFIERKKNHSYFFSNTEKHFSDRLPVEMCGHPLLRVACTYPNSLSTPSVTAVVSFVWVCVCVLHSPRDTDNNLFTFLIPQHESVCVVLCISPAIHYMCVCTLKFLYSLCAYLQYSHYSTTFLPISTTLRLRIRVTTVGPTPRQPLGET